MTNQKNIVVAAFTGRQNCPASYFRVRQHKERLLQRGLTIREFSHPATKRCWYPGFFKAVPYIPGIIESRKYDVVWLCRVMVEGYETFERLLKRPRVMDVDDAIWLTGPFGKYALPHIAAGMDAIIAGNAYIANWFGKYCRQVHIVPTAIDLNRYTLAPPQSQLNGFIIGWTGSSSNFKYLRLIEKPLLRFLTDHPDSTLKIIADIPWNSEFIPPNRIQYIEWSRDNQVSQLYDMSIGIMPLADDQWAAGKCSFKMLQYMAVGLPVVVSPFGMNNDVLSKGDVGFAAVTDDQWYDAIKTLYNSKQLREQLGQAGRDVVEQYFNADVIADKIGTILNNMFQMSDY
jgi:glycosyltransferase involved in cell wall biosynthesis